MDGWAGVSARGGGAEGRGVKGEGPRAEFESKRWVGKPLCVGEG